MRIWDWRVHRATRASRERAIDELVTRDHISALPIIGKNVCVNVPAVRRERFAGHQSRFGVRLNERERFSPDFHIEVTRARLINETELVGCVPDVRAAGGDSVTAGRRIE